MWEHPCDEYYRKLFKVYCTTSAPGFVWYSFFFPENFLFVILSSFVLPHLQDEKLKKERREASGVKDEEPKKKKKVELRYGAVQCKCKRL